MEIVVVVALGEAPRDGAAADFQSTQLLVLELRMSSKESRCVRGTPTSWLPLLPVKLMTLLKASKTQPPKAADY